MHTLRLSKELTVSHNADWSGDVDLTKVNPSYCDEYSGTITLTRDELIDLCAAFILDTHAGAVVLGVVKDKIEERLRDVFMNMPVK